MIVLICYLVFVLGNANKAKLYFLSPAFASAAVRAGRIPNIPTMPSLFRYLQP